MSWLLTFPILIPIGVAIAVYFLSGRPKAIRRASILGAAALFVVAVMLFIVVLRAGVIAGQMGDWPAPFGVTLVADLFSAVMVLIAAVIGLCVAVYALADIDDPREAGGFHAFFHVMLAGVCGAFVAGDLFNLYVWFEVMLIASFALLVLGGEKAQLDGAVKYVALNLISTVFFLTGIGLLYGVTGTLNLAELSRVVAGVDNPAALNAIAVMFIVAFGVKAAMFPLFFWLPASYHTPPVAVTAVFAALLTKVGVYALIRMFTLVFPDKGGFAHELLLIIAILTMTTGVLGAAAQSEFRKILSFHIVSQIGYLILGLAIYSPLAIAGAVYFMVHNIVAKTNLFLVSGAAARLAGDFELQRIGGLYKASPLLAALFFIPAFSLAGFPPLSGFWAKFLLVKASLDDGAYWAAAAALGVGALTLFSMTKIWGEAFLKPHPIAPPSSLQSLAGPERRARLAPMIALAGVTVILGLIPQPFLTIAERAANDLLKPDAYVETVLGARP